MSIGTANLQVGSVTESLGLTVLGGPGSAGLSQVHQAPVLYASTPASIAEIK